MTTIIVTDDTFQAEVLQSDLPVLVDFWAPWCGPCRQVSPVLDELSTAYAGRVKFVKVNTDENPTVSQAYNVLSLPTLNIYRRGELVKQLIGARPKPALVTEIEGVLA